MPVRKTIRFFLNGRELERAVFPETTTLELLRGDLELMGTKEGCGEGDCGACTIVIGELMPDESGSQSRIRYKAAVSCLMLAAQLDGKHLITIEGLARTRDALHPIQQAILDAHATQCGFCTPGIALALLALYLENPRPTPADVHAALSGNLCRCTGYVTIRKIPDFIERIRVTTDRLQMRPAFLDATEARQRELAMQLATDDLLFEQGDQRLFSPASEQSLRAFLRQRPCDEPIQFVNGCSDVVVGIQKRHQHPPCLVDLTRIATLKQIRIDAGRLEFGGSATLEDLAKAARERLPILTSTIGQMASHQVRSIATAAGNVANASPVADVGVLLLALDTTLHIASLDGKARAIPIEQLFLGYKKLSMERTELIRGLSIDLDRFNAVNFEKASKREELDISTVNSAIALDIDEASGLIRSARLSYGGVGPTMLLMQKTSAFLQGKPFAEETFAAAAQIVVTEATPMSDVRGSADYRRTLMKNLLVKHFVALGQSRAS
ncbi:MAG: FAD binding domain-containing protein [Myxococcales bacterium]|jgi:xanthine dehydrogenase small subunit|nr:FAD binding domain-containing protein [Myxococcales bacterium]